MQCLQNLDEQSASGCRIAVIIPVFQTGDQSSTLCTRTMSESNSALVIFGNQVAKNN